MKNMDKRRVENKQIFGNAYLIANSLASGFPKHQFYVRLLTDVWNDRHELVETILADNSIEKTVKLFMRYPGYGGFLGYEFAMDMEMLGFLSDPEDKHTWANPGPGARRGLNFVFGRDRNERFKSGQALAEMQTLYEVMQEILEDHVYDYLDMRFIENGLCETSKYCAIASTGRAKRRYT
jgi:hypothetical protein